VRKNEDAAKKIRVLEHIVKKQEQIFAWHLHGASLILPVNFVDLEPNPIQF